MNRVLPFILFVPALLGAATVSGTVRDPSHAVVPEASVSLGHTGDSDSRNTQTDSQGIFRFADVAPGEYTVTVERGGFDPSSQTVHVSDADIALTFELHIASPETAVEVTIDRSKLGNSDLNYLALRRALPSRAYRVSNLVLKRDVGTFHFTSGTFSFIEPVLGRVAAAVFTGEGTFRLDPATPLERNSLNLISGAPAVEEDFRSVVLWFTDGTFEEVRRQAQAADQVPPGMNAWSEYRNRSRRRTEFPGSNQEAVTLGELYNNNEAGSFTAYIHGNKHSDLRFIVNRRGAMPYLPSPEEVALINNAPEGKEDGIWYLTHYASEWTAGTASSTENRHTVQAEKYRIETAIGTNDHLAATCTLQFKALTAGVRVVGFGLLPSLRVTRVTYNGSETNFIQESRKQDGSFYVIMPDPLAAGQSDEIVVEYEGDRVLRNAGGGSFSVGARTSWYPSLNAFADRATYDLTFKVPKQYTLVSVGKLDKEWREENFAASHWVSDVPLAVAGFNYGQYKKKSVFDKDTNYEVESYATSDVPNYLRQTRMNLAPSTMAESAMVDAENAVRAFSAWFGGAPYGRIAITQQPEFNFGQSWPTLVYLPVSAFLDSTQRWMLMGSSAFRFADFIQEVTPHEVSHQWWGHMVGWASYHDQWLSEGFADFSAGLFLQLTEPKPDKYLKYWDRARETILAKNSFGMRADDAGPLWMGLRLNTYRTMGAYNRLVYPKGGYVLHMLRYLMRGRQTGDADFIAMMHDFVKTYYGKNASTEEFQAMVEKHMKPSMDLAHNGKMDWFFREWVYGTEVPGYHLDYSLTPEADGKALLTGTVTQSGVSPDFVMAMPVYIEIDGHVQAIGSAAITGNSSSNEFKVRLPKRPKRVLLNASDDVLASEAVVRAK